MLSLVIK